LVLQLDLDSQDLVGEVDGLPVAAEVVVVVMENPRQM
jgi:hypothetical protein